MKCFGLAWLLIACAGDAVADQASDIAAALVDMRIYCEDQIGGKMVVRPEALTRFDLTGDGKTELLVDEAGVDCVGISLSDAPRLQGSAGTRLHIVVAGQAFDFVARSWSVVDPIFSEGGRAILPRGEIANGSKIVLLGMSGVACHGAGSARCIEAMVWSDDDKAFMSVRPDASE